MEHEHLTSNPGCGEVFEAAVCGDIREPEVVELGNTIKYVRETKGLTQRAAAKLLGISDVHLCNLEHDKARPSADLLDRMREEWDVDLYILSWCIHGDLVCFSRAVRQAMLQLGQVWTSELEAWYKYPSLKGDKK